MEVSEENVQMILSMGFPSESEVRRALRMAKNDLNDAVAILTNDHPVSSYDALEDLDVEMRETQRKSPQGPVYGPSLPPSYDEAVDAECENSDMSTSTANCSQMDESGSLEFPVTNLYELEGRVFTEMWNIPYKKEESLGRCLVAATRLAEARLAEKDEHCVKFMERCMPEAFQKLLTSGAVHKWGTEIQEGIFDMLLYLVDLVIARLKYQPVPIYLLEVLHMAFTPDTEFHFKNRNRRDRSHWEDRFDDGKAAAITPTGPNKTIVDPYGWLTHLINRFAFNGGLDLIRSNMEVEDLDALSMAALIKPFGVCAEYLNPDMVRNCLASGMEIASKYVQNLEERDFKEKKVGYVSDLLVSMKQLSVHLWPNKVDDLDTLRLDVALRMLKSPHFNAKMNSLKEVSKLIEDCTKTTAKNPIHVERVLDWLVDNRILSIALEGNIDQAQYCDKIKFIVDFLGAKLSLDELSMIWKMQNGQTNNVIDNIHSIVAAAAVKFDAQQLEHLFLLIQKKWQEDTDRMREKLLSLIGKIGKDARVAKTTTRVLELLWDLAHLPVLSTHLIEQALGEHHAILSESYSVKEQVKLQYVIKCVDDIKKGACVLPALRQLICSKNIIKNSFHKTDKGVIHELNKNCDVIKLVTNSLVKCHKQAVSVVGDGQLQPTTIVDGRYSHADYVSTHLNFLQYVLQEGVLYLPWSRARDIWSTLVSGKACEWDREFCYEWFRKGLSDLEADTHSQLFQKEILRLDPAKLSDKGFQCFKHFFESVNMYEHKLKRSGNTLVVEKGDLLGLDYLWEVCLNIPDETIAHSAIHLLLQASYTNLTPRLKKDSLSLHRKFIGELNNRLGTAMIGIGGNVVAQTVSNATKLLTAAIVPEVANVPLPAKSVKLLAIERLLWIAEAYVLTVEEAHCVPRTILAHGASFHGYQINVLITCEALRQEFMLVCHSNETLGSVRQKISDRLNQAYDNIQIVANDTLLAHSKDQKLLHQLEFEDNQAIVVRLGTPSSSSLTPGSTLTSGQNKEPILTPTSKQNYELEQEKMLPGVIMAMGGQVFDMLYQLTEQDEPKLTKRVQKLLMLIPTDPAVMEILDGISHKSMKTASSSDDVSTGSGGKSSPKKPAPPPILVPKMSPTEALKSLFDPQAPDMSAFRLLYNLEVLSSRLMPTTDDVGSRISAQTFCEDFLTAEGLSLVVHILMPESLSLDINYEIRQGCYSICLQLARFLLCGQTVTGNLMSMSTMTDEPGATSLATASPAHTASTAAPASTSTTPRPAHVTTAGSQAIQTLSVQEFTETVACFMKVTWAAAAGRLDLLSFPQPIRETRDSSTFSCGHRSRQSSTGSSTSTNSDSDCQSLHSGVCAHQSSISTKDANIAKEALGILVTCLQLRSQLISSFYSLQCVADFIIEILVACPNEEIRNTALEQFFLLSQTETGLPEDSTVQSPHQFILQVLLKAFLPFWVTSSHTRGHSQRLLTQCSQYFDLRCRLLDSLTHAQQTRLQLDLNSMVEDEIGWLCNFVPSKNPELHATDNTLMAGHLKLIKTLFTCERVKKSEIGATLVDDLLHEFLFPAAKLMLEHDSSSSREPSLAEFNPKCSSSDSRIAAYELLTELAYDNCENLCNICKQLIQMHHSYNAETMNEWEYMPPVDGRAPCGYVGLKNGGATCYMNSVIQQLYMTPGIPEAILGIEEEKMEEDSLFYQMQQIFGHLLESRLQYHEPEKFWNVFKLWGQSINIREQQDAFDFFQALTDQMDEHTKRIGKEEVFKKWFQGTFSDQKICKDCPHRYEREEAFIALNLTVKNATLQDSLDQFVKGELLEGDNAYFCEKCGEKRNTIKRLCIKTLPSLLCIQLKRFCYDWEANRALKFDDFFKFPWVLDMEPYTAEGMARQEQEREKQEREKLNGESETGERINGEMGVVEQEVAVSLDSQPRQINYELVGIVVHSGQANAGHYYSFIKDRRGTVLTNPNKGKWFKFNDTIVEEFEMTDESVEQECFGGTYKAKVYDQNPSSNTPYPEERLRYWNGYLLFYERVEESRMSTVAKRSRIVTKMLHPHEGGKPRMDSDCLMELEELVHKGERRGLFVDRMPASIQQVIHAENVTFVKNRDVYNHDYFRFVKNLVARNLSREDSPEFAKMCVQSLHLGVEFLFNTYLRSWRKTKSDLEEWVEVLHLLMSSCKEATMWLVEYLARKEGADYIKPFLLECPNKDVRSAFADILRQLFQNFFKHGGVATHKSFDPIVEMLLQMLDKDVIDHIKHSVQYFSLITSYILLGTKACAHMFGRHAFQRLAVFLLGHHSDSGDDMEMGRRWSSIQTREFGQLHAALALLILNCDLSSYRTDEPGEMQPVYLPQTVHPHIFLKMSVEMERYVFGNLAHRYLREVVQGVREQMGCMGLSVHITDMLLYCSYCNSHFSQLLLGLLMNQNVIAPSNELRPVFNLLTDILMMQDPLQMARLQWVIDGFEDSKGVKHEGLISVIRSHHVSDSRRAYQCIKFLVNLSNRLEMAKEYLLSTPSKWQWAVNWLKKKMTEYYWNSSSSANLSNEDSARRSFTRTQSAQYTLQEATAMLTELENQEAAASGERDVAMETVSRSSGSASVGEGSAVGGSGEGSMEEAGGEQGGPTTGTAPAQSSSKPSPDLGRGEDKSGE